MKHSRLTAMAVLATAVLVGALGCSPAKDAAGNESTESVADWKPEYKDGVLQPLPDGFPSQDIMIINPDEAGSRDGLYARHWAQAMEKFSPVKLTVTDRPDFGSLFGTWSALDDMERDKAGKEGYMVVVAQIVGAAQDLLSTDVTATLGSQLDDYNFVIGTEQVPHVLAQRKNPPWGSTNFMDMVNYVKAHPGEVTYVCRGPGDGLDLTWKAYSEALGGLKFREVCGEDRQQMTSIVGAGEGDITYNTPGEVLVGVQAGKMDVIFVGGAAPVAKDVPWAGVPNGATILGPDDPWKFPAGFAVAKDVPDLHRQWLYELFQNGIKDPELIKARSTVPGILLFDKPLDHDQSRAAAEANLEAIKPMLQDLNMCPGCGQ
jgi:tripartite-type tricarboxylate transporter receptor subunit TctC